MSRTRFIPRPPAMAVALTLLAGLLPSPAAAQQALDRSSTLLRQREGRQQTYRSMQQSVSAMPPAGARSVDDLFRLKTEGRHLILESPIADDEGKVGSYRVEVPQFRGPTSVTLSTVSFPRAWRAPAPLKVAGPRPDPALDAGAIDQHRAFSLVSCDMPDRDTLVQVNVVSQPAYLHVQRTVQASDTTRTVQIMQQRTSEAVRGPNAATLTMTVSEYSFNAGRPARQPRRPLNLTFQAADFHTLLRQHPREVEEHLRPMLRSVGQEAVFAPDDVVAWQVFAERWKPDPRVLEKVRAILPALDDRDYRKRHEAVQKLEALGKPGAVALMGMDRAGFSAERNLLIDRALASFAQLPPKEAERLRSDTRFLLDCLYSADAEVRSAALERLKKLAGEEIAFDLNARGPDRTAAVAELRRKLLPETGGKGSPVTQPAKS